jgi:hypothetical protein
MSAPLTSPLAITLLLHFYAVCEPYHRPSRAVDEIVAGYLALGFITPSPWGYATTERGDVHANALKVAQQHLLHALRGGAACLN